MNVQPSRSLLHVRMVEKDGHLPPNSLLGVMLKTIRTIEDKNIPSIQGVTGFNQVVIKLQLILDIAFCDYEEKIKIKTYATGFLPRRCPCRASRGIKGKWWNCK